MKPEVIERQDHIIIRNPSTRDNPRQDIQVYYEDIPGLVDILNAIKKEPGFVHK